MSKTNTEPSFDTIHQEVNVLHPEVNIIHPEFDVLVPSAEKQASSSKLKFATSGNGNTRIASNGRTQEARKSKGKSTSPYKLLYKIFERSPLKKKLKVLNHLQRLALQSDEMAGSETTAFDKVDGVESQDIK